MEADGILPLSAILAGALLIKTSVNNIELSNYISSLESDLNKYVDDGDLYKLYGVVGRNSDEFYLICNYNDMCNRDICDRKCTVGDYLYSMTTPEIRSFFGIEEKKTTKKDGIFKKIRTRVFK